MVESIRSSKQSVLLLDCGAVFDNQPNYQEYKAETILKAMEFMGYDALNLGGPEFHFGKDFLKNTRSYISFPYIASNLLYGGSRLPWTREYIIKDMGGVKAAIIGVLNPDDLKKILDQKYVKDLEVMPAEAVLKRLLPEIRGKADIVILLSRLGFEQTLALVKKIEGVDIAVSSGDRSIYPSSSKYPETVVLQTGTGGKALGYARITLNKKGALSVDETKLIPLPESLPEDGRIKEIIQKTSEANRAREAELEERRKKELMEGLKLSPQEFFEQHKKEPLKETGDSK